jgi:hypothetical protein
MIGVAADAQTDVTETIPATNNMPCSFIFFYLPALARGRMPSSVDKAIKHVIA